MTTRNAHKVRAVLLAALMVMWVVGTGIAFAGGVSASGVYDLKPTDGEGGEESVLLDHFDGQLPEGTVSGDDTLQVEARGDSLPNSTEVKLSVVGDNVEFDTSQDEGDIDAEVFGEEEEASDSADVTIVDEETLVIDVDYDGEYISTVLGLPVGVDYDDPKEIAVQNLAFNTSAPDDEVDDDPSLVWEIRNDEVEYGLSVERFTTTLNAADENNGTSASVTAGAANQTIVGPEGGFGYTGIFHETAENLVLQGNENDFPETFEATLSLNDEGITFNEGLNPDDTTANSASGEATVSEVDDTTLVVSVTDFDGDGTGANIVELSGVRFDVPSEAETEYLTWDVRGEDETYRLGVERLTATFPDEHEFTRGQDQQPDSGVEIIIDSDGLQTGGFHEGGEEMALTLQEEGIEFDRSATPSGSYDEPGLFEGGDIDESDVTIERDELRFQVPEDVHNDTTITISEVTFNTTGYNEVTDGGSARLSSGVTVDYSPIGSDETVSVDTEPDALNAEVPEVEIDGQTPTIIPDDETSSSGTSDLALDITDTHGGQMNDRIVVGLMADGNIQFDMSGDELESEDIEGQEFWASVSEGGDEEIILEPESDSSSTAGDRVRLERSDGGFIFDVSGADSGDTANLTVTTDAGSGPVTQTTDAAVKVVDDDTAFYTDAGVLTKGIEHTVNVTVVDTDIDPSEDISLDGPFEDHQKNVDGNTVEFTFTPTTDEPIEITDNDETEEISVEKADLTVEPGSIGLGSEASVVATLLDGANEPLEGEELTTDVDGNITTHPDADETNATGEVVFTLEPGNDANESDSVTIEPENDLGVSTQVDLMDDSVSVREEDEEIPVHETTNVVVTVEEDGDGVEGANVEAVAGDDELASRETSPDGTATLSLHPDGWGPITISAESYGDEAEIEAVDREITVAPAEVDVDEVTQVDVTVTENDENAEGVSVSARGSYDYSEDSVTSPMTFDIEESDSGTITFDATKDGWTVEPEPASVSVVEPDFTPSSSTLTVDEGTNVTVELFGAQNSPLVGEEITVHDSNDVLSNSSDSIGEINESGMDTLFLEGENVGNFSIQAADQTEVIQVVEDDTGTGGGGGAGGGGAPAEPREVSEISVTQADLVTTDAVAGEVVLLTIAAENTGTADGERRVDVQRDGVTIERFDVPVAEGDETEVALPVALGSPGEYEILVDGVDAGTLTVDEQPDLVAAFGSAAVSDGVADFDDDVTVQSIAFSGDVTGTASVSDLEALPSGVEATPGDLVSAMEIDVPGELSEEPATVQFVVDADDLDDADDVRLGRYTDDDWEVYEPELVDEGDDELVFESDVEGFSAFAVFADAEDEQEPDEEAAGLLGPLGVLAIVVALLVAAGLGVAGYRVYLQESGAFDGRLK